MEFSDENLIELVEKYPNLYAKSRSDYKDRYKTQNSWSSIAERLNVQVTDCQYRWGQLRERFVRERRSLKAGFPSGSGSSNPLTPSALYKSLLFLEPHVQTRKTRGNIVKSVSPPEDSCCWETLETVEMVDDDPDVAEYFRILQNKENNDKIEVKNEVNDSEGHSTNKIKPLHENNGNTKHHKNSSPQFGIDGGKKIRKAVIAEVSADNTTIQAVSEALHNVKELCESANKCDDVAYHFCMTMYSQLKTMSKRKQKIARSRISSIMLELESD